MNIEALLNEEIQSEFEVLKNMEAGTDAQEKAVGSLTKLLDRAIEIDRLNIEHEEQEERARDEKRDRTIKNCLTGVSAVGGLALAFVTAIMTMNFEKEGTFTSEAGRSAIRQLLKFK